MGKYQVVVVGTDGSDTSFRAVDRAAAIAAESGAKLIVASAFLDGDGDRGGTDPDQLRTVEYRTQGNAPVYDMLRAAADRAKEAGASDVEERAVEGVPVDALVQLAEDVNADLLVVGNVGANSIVGKVIGSVPKAVERKAKTEVLVVETDG
ncbi:MULTISPECIES: universal stress protein [unclassified Mycobacterium]|uniref:universal stress protein n=1 Tax=unclassified Mycobacterium TaxID=2642494 RepID=UPI00274150CF|nr:MULTISPECIES: universal stress protein [unclassified Mycobacterium]MDP7703288.1 universal stress protein [Mycobacterium sp. TY815]MDP7721696.1 universal stress protein [Mycobacterium sp. TY814]